MARRLRLRSQRLTFWLIGGFAFWVVSWGVIVGIQPAGSISPSPSDLPPLQVHPLPETLLNWRDRVDLGDYFDHLNPLDFGALVWSNFPIQVYIEPSQTESAIANESWLSLAQTALQAWQPYLPLQVTEQPDTADITIRAVAPPLQIAASPTTTNQPDDSPRRLTLGRVRSAEARYQLYLKTLNSGKTELIHRCTININPRQAQAYMYTALLHELGHALGLWGHSLNPQDTMYFSQVQQPVEISERDINTLKRVYQQPTQLGWYLP